MSFAVVDKRGEQDNLLARIVVLNKGDDLVVGVMHHFLARQVGVGDTRTSVEQAQKVVYLGDGADRGAGILARCLLVNGDDGAESGYLVYIGALHIADVASCVGGECIDIAPLSFGKDGVESERRLAAARQSGDDRQCMAGYADADILQVMHPCADDFYFLFLSQCDSLLS